MQELALWSPAEACDCKACHRWSAENEVEPESMLSGQRNNSEPIRAAVSVRVGRPEIPIKMNRCIHSN